MDTDNARLTRQAGTLRITLRYDGVQRTPGFGERHRWAYRLTCTADPLWEPVRGADLYLSPVAPNSPAEAMRSLLSFLTACGEAYAHQMRHPSSAPENLALFPDWVHEAAYLNSEELGSLALELEEPGPIGATGGPDRAPGGVLAEGSVDRVAERPEWRPDRTACPSPVAPNGVHPRSTCRA